MLGSTLLLTLWNFALQLRVYSSTEPRVPSRRFYPRSGVPSEIMIDSNRRRSSRIRLQIPMFIRGVDAHGDDFLDLTKTLNISAVGAYLASPRPLKVNDVVSLKIPAPSPSHSGLVPEADSAITARVRRSVATGDVHLVAVEFLKPLE